MRSQLDILLHVAQVLDGLQIRYLVVGSVASSLQGFSRATADVDMLADVGPDHVRPLFEALRGSYYVDDLAMHRAVVGRRSFNAIHLESLFKVDFILPADDDFSRRQFERRQQAALTSDATQTIWIAAPEDTILAKLRRHLRGGGVSDRQLADALGVIKVQSQKLDLDYLREWAERMGARDLLERLPREASDKLG